MFETWSLRKKLLSSFALASAFLLSVGSYAFYELKNVTAAYSHVVEINFENSQKLATIRAGSFQTAVAMAKLSHPSVTEEHVAELRKDVNEARESILKASTEYEKVPFVEGEEPLWKEIVSTREGAFKTADDIINFVESKKVNPEEKEKLLEARGVAGGAFRAALGKMLDFQEAQAVEHSTIAHSAANRATLMVTIIVIIGLCASMILGVILAKSLSTLLTAITAQLSEGANEVASAATQISSTSEELSSAATEQAAALQETAASVEEMSAMIKKSADSSSTSRTLTGSSQQTAQRGKETVEEMLAAINEIDASNREVSEVVKVIADIGSKTKVINDIVFKTQLLSFNASVEAARAGEHGKGFAVVAEEVGNLAQMSGTAANQISALLEESLSKVERLISTSKSKVDSGLTVSKRCGEVLDEIVRNINDVNLLSSEIETASQEQSRGVNEITKAMTQLDQVTQQNAAASQQSASASEQLAGQASILQQSVIELEGAIYGVGVKRTGTTQRADKKKKSSKPALKVASTQTSAKRSNAPAGNDPGFGEEAA